MFDVSHVAQAINSLLDSVSANSQSLATLDAAVDLSTKDAATRAVLRSIVAGPEPLEALRRAARLPNAALNHPKFSSFAPLLHQGNYPARLCGLFPQGLAAIDPLNRAIDVGTPDLAALSLSFRDAHTEVGDDDAIGRVCTAEYLNLCALEVAKTPLEQVCKGLSELASSAVQFALSLEPTLKDRVVVFGMGKLGGLELNFRSDIDLVFIHADAPTLSGPEGHRERMRLHDAIRRVVARLEGAGVWRPLFRVDLRLRPFGSRGPISSSYAAAIRYFEAHGRGWERQVWMRARPIAGDIELGEQLLRELSPFVYRQSISLGIIDEIKSLTERARREVARRPDVAGTDVKHDRGCIREIEFFTQGLQLLHGGKIKALRTPSTMAAFDRLLAHGFLSDREHDVLSHGYRWLRRLEHRTQLEEGLQTHFVSHDLAAVNLLSARIDAPTCQLDPKDEPGASLLSELENIRQAVISLCDPEDERDAPEARAARLDKDAVLDPMASDGVAAAALQRLGANDGAEALALVRALRSGAQSALNANGTSFEGARRLMFACLQSGDAERALSRMVSFSSGRPAHFSVWRLLARDEHQRIVRLLADLFSLNDSLSQGLIGFPHTRGRAEDASFTFLADASLDSPLTSKKITEHFTEQMSRLHAEYSVDEVDGALNHTRHRLLTHIALHDLAHQPPAQEVGARLADLADEVLRRMLEDLVLRNAAALNEAGVCFDLTVLALGKLGMRFMDFGSDLDLVFVFQPCEPHRVSSEQVREYATRVGVQMMSRLRSRAGGAQLYDVDTRLRPSGRQGLLVSSRDAFSRYQRSPLPVWERLASLWIRPVAVARFGADPTERLGDDEVSRWASGLASETRDAIMSADLQPEQIATDTAQILNRVFRETSRETRTMRSSLEQMRTMLDEVGSEMAPHAVLDAKLGPGACLDFELGVGALFLRHREALKGLDTPPLSRVSSVIDALQKIDVLCSSQASDLRSAYAFLRKFLNRLRMDAHKLGDGSADSFSTNSPRLPRVARRMGIEDETALVRQFLEHRIAVHSILNALLPPR